MKWISVDDKLPDNKEDNLYLIWATYEGGEESYFALYCPDDKYEQWKLPCCCWERTWSNWKITHWACMPKNPEKQEKS